MSCRREHCPICRQLRADAEWLTRALKILSKAARILKTPKAKE